MTRHAGVGCAVRTVQLVRAAHPTAWQGQLRNPGSFAGGSFMNWSSFAGCGEARTASVWGWCGSRCSPHPTDL